MNLRDLLSKTKDLLSRPTRDATEAVKQDSYDRGLFEELLGEAPALRETVAELGQDVNYAEDVVRDTLMQLWKGDPTIRPRTEMAEPRLVQHAVATDVESSDELADARRYTMHDRYAATMATIGISDTVHEYAQRHKEELEKAQEEKEKAEQGEQQAQEQAEQAADALEDSPFLDPDFHGPPSPDQQAQAEAMEQALAELEEAQQANDQASQQLDQQADQAQKELARPVTQAVTEAKEKLEEEAKLFEAWGYSDGDLQQMSFEERAALAQQLRSNRMSKFMELVGRFKLMAAAQRVRKIEYGRDQVVGVELSGDLSRIMMAEFFNLGMGEEDDDVAELFELDFYRRFAEGQLLSREFVGTEKVGKGAIICALDNSGSMSAQVAGITREAWGKALALAMFDVAKRQGRQFVGINFSSHNQVSVHSFKPGHYEIRDVLAWAQEFFGGGTNFEAPLDRAVDLLEDEFNEKGKEKGDIVFMTDDTCSVSPEWMRKYLARKEKLDFRVFGIAIGSDNPDGTLASLSDNVRGITEFMDPEQVRDIFQVV